MLAWLNLIQKRGENDQCIIDGADIGMKIKMKMCGFLFRQGKGDGKTAIPESGMVGADVAHYGEVVQERAENFLIEPIIVSNDLAVGWGGEIVVEGGELPDTHDFTHHPNGRAGSRWPPMRT